MITWKDVYVQEEMRKVRMAQAEGARMMKAVRATKEDKGISKKKKPYLLSLSVVTKLVQWGDALRARRTDLSLAGER
jgi:hypothetical protein